MTNYIHRKEHKYLDLISIDKIERVKKIKNSYFFHSFSSVYANIRLEFDTIDITKLFYPYMSAIAGQTAGPNGLNFFEETHGFQRGNIG